MSNAKPFQLENRYIVLKKTDLHAAVRNGAVTEDEATQLDVTIGAIALDRYSHDLPPRDCLVIEKDWPEYAPALAAIEARVNGEIQKPQTALSPKKAEKHHYLVSWVSERRRGSTEVPMSMPWAAGDSIMVVAYLMKLNPADGVITIVSAMPIAPPREVVEEEPEPEAPAEQLVDVYIGGKLVRTGATLDDAWDIADKRYHLLSYEFRDSKTGKPI